MPAAAALDDALLYLGGIPAVHPRLGRCVRPEPGLDDLGSGVADLPDEDARPVQEPVNLIGLARVRVDAEQRCELGLLGHDARCVHVSLDLLGAVGIFGIAVGEEGGAVGAEARRGARSGHAADDGEGHGRVAGGGGEARDAGEGGLVGLDAVGLHPGEDVEAALSGGGGDMAVRVGSGGVGAEVEQAVVVVEGERDGVVRGEGVVVEAERGGEVGVAGAHVELVAEEALGRFTGAAAAHGLAFATAGAGVLQRWGRSGGGVAASASKGEVSDQDAAALVWWGGEEAEGGGRGSEDRRRHGGTHGFGPLVVGVGLGFRIGLCWAFDLRQFSIPFLFIVSFPFPFRMDESKKKKRESDNQFHFHR